MVLGRQRVVLHGGDFVPALLAPIDAGLRGLHAGVVGFVEYEIRVHLEIPLELVMSHRAGPTLALRRPKWMPLYQ